MVLARPHLTVVRDALANTVPPLRPHTRSASMVCAPVLVRIGPPCGYGPGSKLPPVFDIKLGRRPADEVDRQAMHESWGDDRAGYDLAGVLPRYCGHS